MSEELIYALDVGTRKVMGLVARRTSAGVAILACDVAEHPTRSMSGGEVRDVRAVGDLIRGQVERLSQRVGSPLKQVAVAVAGRDLRTSAGRATLTLSQAGPIEKERTRFRACRAATAASLPTLASVTRPRAISSTATPSPIPSDITRPVSRPRCSRRRFPGGCWTA
jgi:cell division ATPase FtsA